MSGQPSLFDGPTFEPAHDAVRLTGQLLRVFTVMRDNQWRTLKALGDAAARLRDDGGRDSEAALSARLRDLRKDRFGKYDVERRRVSGGLYEYRIAP